MSFHNTALCFFTFIVVINPYSLFKFKLFVLNTSLFTFMLHFVVGTITHGYNTVEHSTTGANNRTDANNCTGANYCKALI